jgi:hypothetical protein
MAMTIKGTIEFFREGNLTRDELLGSLLALLSENPSSLREVRDALSVDSELRGAFEIWLDGIRERPPIKILMAGRYVVVSEGLLKELARQQGG